MERWHALYTKPHMELRVAGTLAAREIEVFAPMVEYHGKRGGLLEKPLFPRYILARFDWNQGGVATIQWTPGLSRVVTFDGEPAWLDDRDVNYLQAKLAQLDGDAFMRLKPGEAVRVKKGPFRDFDAIFASYVNGSERVAVLLEILGRRTKVCLSLSEIERSA